MKKNTILIGLGVLFVLVLLFSGLFYFGVFESILGVSDIKLVNGRVYHVITGVGGNVDEGFTFSYKAVNKTLSDGSVVVPKQDLSLMISKDSSGCVYQLQKKSYPVFLGLSSYDYYVLNPPTRFSNIKVVDGNGVSVLMDATLQSSKVINDVDGVGSVTIETQGILSSNRDCPEYSNLALLFDNNGIVKFKNEASLLDKYNNGGFKLLLGGLVQWVNYASTNVQDNTQFTQGFTSAPVIDGAKTRLTGSVNIGNGVFTITADQDYFDSFVYTPPKLAKPVVGSVNCQDILKDGNGVLSAVINNNGDKATISVDASAKFSNVQPSSQNIVLDKSALLYFTVKASSSSGSEIYTIKTCSVNQFGLNTCDSKSVSCNIVDDKPKSFCGDGVCDSSLESNNNCPGDCKVVIPTNDTDRILKCEDEFFGLVSSELGVKEECSFLCKIGISNPKPVNTCVKDYSLLIIASVFVLIIFGLLLWRFGGNNGGKKSVDNKDKFKVFGVILALIILVVGFFYFFAYIFWITLLIIVGFIVYKIFFRG